MRSKTVFLAKVLNEKCSVKAIDMRQIHCIFVFDVDLSFGF
jgi:hypothetical protein